MNDNCIQFKEYTEAHPKLIYVFFQSVENSDDDNDDDEFFTPPQSPALQFFDDSDPNISYDNFIFG